MMKRTIFALSLFCALWAVPAPASILQTFNFSGVCSDCEGNVTATLVLQDYVPGTALANENFVSFSYGGSNLLPAYTISGQSFGFLSGNIPASLPGAALVIVFGVERAFFSQDDGSWDTGVVLVSDPGDGGFTSADFGQQGNWGNTSAVPEPGTMAMLGSAGLALLALRRRQGRS
jgi:hypothetical protein